MKINHLSAESFMLFDSIDMQFSDNINVIFGENSTGKTALIKTLYSAGKLLADNSDKKEDQERFLLNKLIGVFQPDKSSIGRLVARQQGGGKAKVVVSFDKSNQIDFSFGYKQTNHLTVDVDRTEKFRYFCRQRKLFLQRAILHRYMMIIILNLMKLIMILQDYCCDH